MRKFLILFCVSVFFLAMFGTASANTITYSILDIGTFADYENTNTSDTYSGTGFVGLYDDAFVHLFGLEQDDFSRTAMQVDITALADSVINSAFLSFELKNGSDATQNVTLTSYTANGTLGHFWNAPDNIGSGVYSVTGLSANTLDVTSLLSARVAADADWLGLHLQASDMYHWTYTWEGYGDSADEAVVRLNVDYTNPVPEPATMLLLGTGLVGLAVFRRKKKK